MEVPEDEVKQTYLFLGDYQAAEKQTDDLEDDEDPEWLDFEPQEKKFDFSKQQPLTKMFEGNDEIKYEALEDDEEDTNPTSDPKPISIEQLEKQTFSRLEQEKQKEPVFAQSNFMSNPMGNTMNNPMSNPMGNPAGNLMNNPMGNPMANPMGNPMINQMNNLMSNPMGNQMNNPMGNQMNYGQDMHNYGFGMQNYPQYQDQNMGQYGNQMGYGGFSRPDPFGGFGNPFDNSMGMPPLYDDPMGFGGSLFSPPSFGRDPEYDKIFGNSGHQNQINPFFQQENPMGKFITVD